MRLSKNEFVELLKNLAKLRAGQTPGILSGSKFKELAKHSSLQELFEMMDDLNTIAANMKSKDDFDKYMRQSGLIINTYLDRS